MLTALDKNGKTVNISNNQELSPPFYCPACKSLLHLKKGMIKIPHFAHVSLQNCDSWSENESAQHLELKLELSRWFEQTEKVEIEKYIPEIKQTADLLVNDRLAIEIQCSSLSLKRLMERTTSYREKGYYVLWLQGKDLWLKNSITALQKNLLYYTEKRGFYFWELDLARAKLRLKTLIHQDLRGRLLCLTEEFDWFQGNLLEILRLPYLKPPNHRLFMPENKNMAVFIQKQLFHHVPKWIKIQQRYYELGRNLLTENWEKKYWSPPGLNLLTYEFEKGSEECFCQVEVSLEKYYHNFYKKFKAEELRELHAPSFYAIMEDNIKKEDGERNGKKA